jgi:hypothetical protein
VDATDPDTLYAGTVWAAPFNGSLFWGRFE